MRKSQAPTALDSAGHPSTGMGAVTDGGKNTIMDEAETLATQGNASGTSPRGQALSQGHFNRLDSEVIATSDKQLQRRMPDNRRFHASHRANVSYTSRCCHRNSR